jgi:hypothetical protein
MPSATLCVVFSLMPALRVIPAPRLGPRSGQDGIPTQSGGTSFRKLRGFVATVSVIADIYEGTNVAVTGGSITTQASVGGDFVLLDPVSGGFGPALVAITTNLSHSAGCKLEGGHEAWHNIRLDSNSTGLKFGRWTISCRRGTPARWRTPTQSAMPARPTGGCS